MQAAFRWATAPDPEALDLADFDLISVCTQAQAIADGVLIDVTETARDAGLRWPTALTAAAYERHMKKIPERSVTQDEARRLRDVLRMCRFGLGREVPGSTEVLFQLHVRINNRDGIPPPVTLKAVCGPDDAARPCLTIISVGGGWKRSDDSEPRQPPTQH